MDGPMRRGSMGTEEGVGNVYPVKAISGRMSRSSEPGSRRVVSETPNPHLELLRWMGGDDSLRCEREDFGGVAFHIPQLGISSIR